MKYILVTGAAGFIGFHLVKELQKNKNYLIVGIDNLNNYYDVELKKTRVSILQRKKNFIFFKIDITNLNNLRKIFKKYKLQYVVNLAAQAGVRYSIEKPSTYFKSNLEGFFNVINLSKDYGIKHFVFASTSSVYGNQTKFPIKENYDTDKPLSFYAATKKSNEVIAHSFSNIYALPSTGLRFFTVYGPYGRPDMALYKFSMDIINNKSIKLFNYGDHERDFTFITDIVEGIIKIISKPPKKKIPYEIFNIGGNKSYKLKRFISIIENNLKTKAKFEYLPLQKGDVRKTQASTKKLNTFINKKSYVKLEFGIKKFIKWFNNTYEKK